MKHFLLSFLILLFPLFAVAQDAVNTDSIFLTRVNSVKAGDQLIFERNGAVLLASSSSPLPATTDWTATDLTGTEGYVWTLRSAGDNVFYLCSAQYDGIYLFNKPNAQDLMCSTSPTRWKFEFAADSTATIATTDGRFIGETSDYAYKYKAYPQSGLASHGHDFTIWRLDHPEPAPTALDKMVNGTCENGKFLHDGQLLITRDGKTFNILGAQVH